MNRLTEQFFSAPTGVFTQSSVGVAIGGSEFSRHALIKRAMASGEILRIRRGLYCLAPKYQKRPISTYSLAHQIYGPSYISLESALSYHGWIPEAVHACTCVSFNNAKEFDTPLGLFCYTRVPQKRFYSGIERYVDRNGNLFFIASPAKALADYVYARRPDWTSVADASASLRFDPDEASAIDPGQLSALVDNYTNSRVKHFLASWMEVLGK